MLPEFASVRPRQSAPTGDRFVRSSFRDLIKRAHIANDPALAMVPLQVRKVASKAITDEPGGHVWCRPRLDGTERLAFSLAFDPPVLGLARF